MRSIGNGGVVQHGCSDPALEGDVSVRISKDTICVGLLRNHELMHPFESGNETMARLPPPRGAPTHRVKVGYALATIDPPFRGPR